MAQVLINVTVPKFSIEHEWSCCDPRYPDKLPEAEFYAQLTLALGLKKVKASMDWCEESITRVKKRRGHVH